MKHEYENIHDYEQEILERIEKENPFSDVQYSQHDILGEFIDRVIDRSLYIYKNR